MQGPSPGAAASAALKGARGLIPVARAIRGEPIGIVRAQCDLLCRQLARSSHDLEHDLRSGLAGDDQAVDFTRLDRLGCGRNRRLRKPGIGYRRTLLADSSREARFTVSPMTVSSS